MDAFEKKAPLWQRVFYNGSTTKDPFTLRQLFFINTFSIIGAVAGISVGILNFFGERNYEVIIPDILTGFVFLLTLILLRISKNIVLAKTIMLAMLSVLLVILLATGGTAHTGIYWYFTFPIAAFFLMGRVKGILWILFLSCVTVVITILGTLGYIPLAYSIDEIRQMFITLCIVCLLIYAYQYAIEQTEEQEKGLDRAKSEFIALASHQLRTPISAISWFTEMLLHGDSGPVNEEQKDHLTKVYQSNERMAELVTSLLYVSQIELGTVAIKLEPVDLSNLSHTVLEQELKKYQMNKKLVTEENYDRQIPKILIDPEIMKIVFQHLFSNAIKYSRDGGLIRVDISSGQTYTKSGNNKDAGILIQVTDSGIGIPKHQTEKIFLKLFRADNARTIEPDGTGLGLYICKAVIEQAGGKIWFTSEENKGTKFFVWLPASGMKYTSN